MVIGLFVAYTNPKSALYGFLLVLISVPVFIWLKRNRHLGDAEQRRQQQIETT